MQVSGIGFNPYVYQQSTETSPLEVVLPQTQETFTHWEENSQRQAKPTASSLSSGTRAALLGVQTIAEEGSANQAGPSGADLDAFYADTPPATSGLISDIPEFLFPTAENLQAISEHASARFQELLSQYNIPSAPSEITYDAEGKMQLPSDYAHAEELEQALEENPGLARELRDLNAISSHYEGMKQSLAFQEEYSAASSDVELQEILAKYSSLFQPNKTYARMALEFTENGRITVTANGENVLASA